MGLEDDGEEDVPGPSVGTVEIPQRKDVEDKELEKWVGVIGVQGGTLSSTSTSFSSPLRRSSRSGSLGLEGSWVRIRSRRSRQMPSPSKSSKRIGSNSLLQPRLHLRQRDRE